MQVEISIDKKDAFVLRAESVAGIWEALQQVGDPVATVHCSDSVVRSFENLDGLLSYSSPPSRAITKINIFARTKDYNSRAEVEFSSSQYGPASALKAKGDEMVVSALRREFCELTEVSRPWYFLLARMDFLWVVMPVAVFFLGTAIMMGSGGDGTRPELGVEQAALLTAMSLMLVALGALIVWLPNRLLRRFFPIATFAIGEGKRRHESDEKIRWAVFMGLGVSVGGSIFVAVLGL